jgi:hypothetical protein
LQPVHARMYIQSLPDLIRPDEQSRMLTWLQHLRLGRFSAIVGWGLLIALCRVETAGASCGDYLRHIESTHANSRPVLPERGQLPRFPDCRGGTCRPSGLPAIPHTPPPSPPPTAERWACPRACEQASTTAGEWLVDAAPAVLWTAARERLFRPPRHGS